MSIPVKEKGYGNFLSFMLTVVFAVIMLSAFWLLANLEYTPKSIAEVSLYEFIILSLAAFCLTRLFVYDSVAQYVRDLFLIVREEKNKETGVIYVYRKKPEKGLRRLCADLLSCPWCTGMWMSLFSGLICFLLPWTWFIWLVLALAGLSSFIQISANGVGWRAEYKKLKVKAKEEKLKRYQEKKETESK